MKKLPKLSLLKKKAWKSFSDFIRTRDDWTCVTCGRKGTGKDIHAGHALTKRMHGALLMFDDMNVHAQCYICNRYMEGAGIKLSIYIREKYGFDADKRLIQKIGASKKFKPNRQWYELIKKKYDALLEAEKAIKEHGPDYLTNY
jgi:hypothetical protein